MPSEKTPAVSQAPWTSGKAIISVTRAASMIPVATVAATFSEMNAPAKLRIAESPTAARGESAPVEIDEAIALAAS